MPAAILPHEHDQVNVADAAHLMIVILCGATTLQAIKAQVQAQDLCTGRHRLVEQCVCFSLIDNHILSRGACRSCKPICRHVAIPYRCAIPNALHVNSCQPDKCGYMILYTYE